MKVIQLNVTYGNADSTGRNVKELHNYLLARGFDSHVYTTEINDESELDDRIHLFSSNRIKCSITAHYLSSAMFLWRCVLNATHSDKSYESIQMPFLALFDRNICGNHPVVDKLGRYCLSRSFTFLFSGKCGCCHRVIDIVLDSLDVLLSKMIVYFRIDILCERHAPYIVEHFLSREFFL